MTHLGHTGSAESGGALPRMALRPDERGATVEHGTLMDDIVVKDVEMFRAEQMDTDVWWVCCYLTNGEQVVWHVTAHARPRRLEWRQGDFPEFHDIDQEDAAA